MAHVYVIHENSDWTKPLLRELTERETPHREWFLDRGIVDFENPPPEGVFYNRMSASSHTRGHRFSPELTKAVLLWLESHGRRVINDSRAMSLEIDKTGQYAALSAYGVPTPRTIAAVGRESILEAAAAIPAARILTKHNRAGKGLGVRLFENRDALSSYVFGDDFADPIDGITLVQEFIEAPDQTIRRLEFVSGKFLYAVQVDTSAGFELCPADTCQPGDAFCPVGSTERPKFEILDGFDHPLIRPLEKFLAEQGMKVAAVEIIEDAAGRAYAYDVNINTNYNAEAEARAGQSGMGAIADFLSEELSHVRSGELREVCALS